MARLGRFIRIQSSQTPEIVQRLAQNTFFGNVNEYRFYAENSSVSSFTALAATNTAITANTGSGDVHVQLSFRIQETGGHVDQANWQLQASKNGDAFAGIAVGRTDVTSYDDASLTNNAAVVIGNRRTSAGTGTWADGNISEDGNANNVDVPALGYTEVTYTVAIIAANVANGDVITFRLQHGGVLTDITNSVTPTINVVVPTLAVDIDRYRWYNTGWSIASGGAAVANANTAYNTLFPTNEATNVALQLSYRLQETGGVADVLSYQLQASRNGDAFTNIAARTDITGFDDTALTDQETIPAGSKRLTAGTGTYSDGIVSEDGGAATVTLTANGYTEITYSINLVNAQLTDGDQLTFRLRRNNSLSNITNSVTPTINLQKLFSFGKTDSTTIGSSETSAVTASWTSTDTSAVVGTDASTAFGKTTTDTSAISSSETSAIVASWTSTDTSAIVGTEGAPIKSFNSSDSHDLSATTDVSSKFIVPVRGYSSAYVNNASSVNITIPSITQVGDQIVLVAGHGWDLVTPTGFTRQDYQTGPNFNGATYTRTAQSGDAGSTVTFSFSDLYYGYVAIMVLDGSYSSTVATRSATDSTPPETVTQGSVSSSDTLLYFGLSRASSSIPLTLSRGAVLSNTNNTTGSLVLGYETAASGSVGQNFGWTGTLDGFYFVNVKVLASGGVTPVSTSDSTTIGSSETSTIAITLATSTDSTTIGSSDASAVTNIVNAGNSNLAIASTGGDGYTDSALVDYSASSLYTGVETDRTLVGFFRFTSVAVPQGTRINKAQLTVNVISRAGSPSFDVSAVVADNVAQVAAYADISGATRTTAKTIWTPNDVGLWNIDVTAQVQEIVNRTGWVSGNAIEFVTDSRVAQGSITEVQITDYSSSPTLAAKFSVGYAAADTSAISSSETATFIAQISTTDSTVITGTDTITTKAFNSSDSTLVVGTDVSALQIGMATSTDTGVINSSETTAFATVAVTATDSTVMVGTEANSTNAGQPGVDNTTIGSSETSAVVASWTSTDSTIINSSETALPLASWTSTDSTTIVSSETTATTVSFSTTDTSAMVGTETAAVTTSFTATDTSAMVGTDTVLTTFVTMTTTDSTVINSSETATFATVTVTTTDSTLMVGTDATSTIFVVLTASDSTVINSSETTAFATVAVTTTDSTTIASSETVNINAGQPGTDSTQIGSSETATLFVTFAPSTDSTLIVGTDVSSFAAVAVTTTDSTVIASSETTSFFVTTSTTDSTIINSSETAAFATVAVTASDSTVISGTETSSPVAQFTATDSTIINSSETTAFGTTSVSATDSTAMVGTDASAVTAAFSTSDSSIISSSETTAFATVSVSASDSVAIAASETSVIAGYISVTDSGTPSVSESVAIFVTLSASDSTAMTGTDASSLAITYYAPGTDTGVINSSETTDIVADGVIEINGTDSSTIVISESVQITAFITGTETPVIGNADTSQLIAIFTSTDTGAIDSTETYQFATVAVTGSETLFVGNSETSAVTVIISASDSSLVSADDAGTLVIFGLAYITSDDSSVIGSSETSDATALINTTDDSVISSDETATFATVNVTASDDININSDETYEFATVEVNVTDSSQIDSTEDVQAYVVTDSSDDLTLISDDQAYIFVDAPGTDDGLIISTETTDIEISGLVEKTGDDSNLITASENYMLFVARTSDDTDEIISDESTDFIKSGDDFKSSDDSSAISAIEITEAVVVKTAADTSVISSTETYIIPDPFITGIDSTNINSVETSEVHPLLPYIDFGSINSVETSTIVITGLISITSTDILHINSSEQASLPADKDASDTLALSLTETAAAIVIEAVSASDTSAISSTETTFIRKNVVVSDTLFLGLEESVSIVKEQVTPETGLGEGVIIDSYSEPEISIGDPTTPVIWEIQTYSQPTTDVDTDEEIIVETEFK